MQTSMASLSGERAEGGSLLRPGDTCWRREHADRFALLIDGEAYFEAVDAALGRATRSVLIAGWDLCSRIRLRHAPDAPTLVERLDALVRQRRELHVHLLDWDYPFLYALDRELLPTGRLGWRTHRRVHFHLDSTHPFGASHHQKIVVVDDRVAFAGGLDLTDQRWDTREHRPDEPGRRSVNGSSYAPHHDVQAAVDGDAARALGDLLRERWRVAAGDRLDPPSLPSGAEDPWPDVDPLVRDVEVAIARTEPAWHGGEPVREVERLMLAAIGAARRALFMEEQYLTSERVARALEERLSEQDGPEIVILLPSESGRWLEDSTMGVRRQAVLQRLTAADAAGRLTVRAPMAVDGDTRVPINLHSKLLIADDRLLRVGSANASNRSMRLDTECDLALEAAGDGAERISEAIRRVRHDLLAEHLGARPEQVAEAVEREGTLGGAMAALSDSSGRRQLTPVEGGDDWRWLHEIVPADRIADPEQPFEPEDIADHLLHDHAAETERGGLRPHLPMLLLLGVALVVAAAWRWTPLGDLVDVERIAGWIDTARGVAWAPLAGAAASAVGSLLLVPLALLILGCVVTMGVGTGFTAYYVGMAFGAAAAWGLGRILGGDWLHRAVGGRFGRLRTILDHHGMVTVAALRLVPLAPFGVINAVAGHLGVPFGSYMAGTLIGMLPGTLVIALFGTAIESALVDQPSVLVWLVAALLVLAAGGVWMLRARWQKALARRSTSRE